MKVFFIKNSTYTTCDLDTAHFHFESEKMKIIQNDVVIARPIILHIGQIPILGIPVAIIIPVSVFIWLYLESKDRNITILEISKNLEDPSKLEGMIDMLDERKKEPIDFRRTGVVTLFTGVGLFLFGVFFLGSVLKGVGALVTAIGLGQIIAGYLYPNTSEELTNAVEDFEKK